MSKTTPQKLAQAKYDQKSYDQILIKVRKGKRDEYKNAAETLGLGQMELFRTAVEEYIQNRTSEVVTEKREVETLTAEQRRLLENFARLPKSTRTKFTGLLEEVAAQLKGGEDND